MALTRMQVKNLTAKPETSPTKPSAVKPDALSKKIIPWLEVNNPKAPISDTVGRHASQLDHCLEGLDHWSKVTGTAIVSTTVARAESLYPELMRSKPETLRIIGGLKTHVLPGASPKDERPYDFADAEGWKAIAESVRSIARLTGTNIVLLENETALAPFHRDEADIDFKKFRAAFHPLRKTGIETWWMFPNVLSDPPRRRRERTTRLLEAVSQTLPDARFIAAYVGWYDWKDDRVQTVLREEMIRKVGQKRLREMIYVREDGYIRYSALKKRRCFTVEEASRHIAVLPGDAVIVYPGAIQWITIAKQWARRASQTRWRRRHGSDAGAD